jgi:hypothetical protein
VKGESGEFGLDNTQLKRVWLSFRLPYKAFSESSGLRFKDIGSG